MERESHFLSYEHLPMFDYMFYNLCDDIKVFTDYYPSEGIPMQFIGENCEIQNG